MKIKMRKRRKSKSQSKSRIDHTRAARGPRPPTLAPSLSLTLLPTATLHLTLNLPLAPVLVLRQAAECYRPPSPGVQMSKCTDVSSTPVDALDDDDNLLRRCQQGDDSALAELVRRFQDRVFRLAYRVTGDAAAAEEAAADVFVKVWRRAGQWRGESSAGTWIYRIAVRTVLDHERGRHRWWRRWATALPGFVADPRPDPARLAADREHQRNGVLWLQEALGELPEADRVLVHLHYFEDRKLADLEPILGASRDALKMRLARARQKLRDLLGTY